MNSLHEHPARDALRGNRVPRPWPHEYYLLVFLGIMGVLVACAPGELPDRPSMIYEIGLLCLLVLLCSLTIDERRGSFLFFLRAGYFLLPILYTFRLLHFLIPALRNIDGSTEWTLIRMDQWLLGDHAVAYIQSIRTPLLTEVMYYFYSTYYVVPAGLVLVVLVCYRRGTLKREALQKLIGGITLGFVTSYLIYLLVPARGPLHALPPGTIVETLESAWIGESIHRTIMSAEMKMYDVFPSGHTEVYLITVLYARRYTRSLFWWVLVLFVGMVMSTLYLQYHYVVDLVAGGALGVAVVWFQDVLFSTWGEEFE